MSEQKRLVAEVDAELKERAQADPRSIREIVTVALEREFATTETAAVERRLDEKQQRIQTLQREINDRERELAAEREDLERLETQLEQYSERRQQRFEEARDVLADVPKDADNAAVKNWAQKLNMTPQELLDEL